MVTKARNAAMSNRLLRRLRAMRSLKVPWSLWFMVLVVGDGHGLPLRALGLEVFLLGESHSTGEDDRGEALDLGVVGLDRVVVVLPSEGDLVLRRRELLLKVDQNRVGTQLRIILGDGEQVPDGP